MNLLIADVNFLNLHYGDVEDLSDATMEEYIKFPKKGFSK
jgi:hypothetical protein